VSHSIMVKSEKNRGSATVEATLILPIFIFSVLVLFHGVRLRQAEAVLYEAAAETVEYMAELSYLEECNSMVPRAMIGKYVDNKSLVEHYIIGGIDGVTFQGSVYLDEDGYVCLKVNYKVGINVPIIGSLSGNRSYEIRQKAYIGDSLELEKAENDRDDIYVYITDNREAYHTTRACSHLDLTITPSTIKHAKEQGYTSCDFCGGDAQGGVLITKNGGKYDSSRDWVGLKRTVYRVKKSQVEGLGACERCGFR